MLGVWQQRPVPAAPVTLCRKLTLNALWEPLKWRHLWSCEKKTSIFCVTHKTVSICTKCSSQQVGTKIPPPGPRASVVLKPSTASWPCVQYLLTMFVTCRESSHHSTASHQSASSCSCYYFAADRSRCAAIQKLDMHRVWKVHSSRTSLPGSCTLSTWVFEGPRLVLSLEPLFLAPPEDSGPPFPCWLYIPSDTQEIHSRSPCPNLFCWLL